MVSTKEFYQFIGRYQLDEALAFISRIANKIYTKDQNFFSSGLSKEVRQNINTWQLAFLAQSLIMRSNDHRYKILNESEFVQCANLYNDLESNTEVEGNSLLRIAYQQFPHQQQVKNNLGRSLYMYLDINEEVGFDKFNIDQEFKKIYDLSILDFIVIGFSLFTLALCDQGEIYFPIESKVPGLADYLTPKKIEKFLSITMADYKKFRNCQEREPSRPGYEKYEFNCLRKYPIIQTEKQERLLVPIPLFLLERITKGIFYGLRDHFNEGGKSNKFATFFGKNIFEGYVGMLFRELYSHGLVLPEQNYRKGNDSFDTSDWIIVENNTCILVECKTSNLTQEAKSFTDKKELLDNLKKRIIKGIKTCCRTEKDSQYIPQELSKITSFHYLIVTADDSYFCNSPFYRQLIDPELLEMQDLTPKYHIVSILELENLFGYLEEVSLGELLRQKEQNPEWYEYDFREFLKDFGPKVLGKKISWCNRLLEKKYNYFFKDILKVD